MLCPHGESEQNQVRRRSQQPAPHIHIIAETDVLSFQPILQLFHRFLGLFFGLLLVFEPAFTALLWGLADLLLFFGAGATAFLGTLAGVSALAAGALPMAPGFAETEVFPTGASDAEDAAAAMDGGTPPFLFTLPAALSGVAGAEAPAAAALAPRPRLAGGGGGGGGGGGASGLRYLSVSVRERSFPSNRSMNTSFAIFGYSGSCGVICSSVISGDGTFCCTCRHLVKKFLIFCVTVC
jgi:hypothetical protein